MPKTRKQRTHTTGLKRLVEDKNVTTNPLVKVVEHFPRYKSQCTERIHPSNTTDFNNAGSFVFDISTGKDDILFIKPFHQMIIEGRTKVTLRGSSNDNTTKLRVANASQAEQKKLLTKYQFAGGATKVNEDGSNQNAGWSPWKWAIGTGALVLFNDSERSYNGKVIDDSTSWPQRGHMLNNEAAISYYFSGDDELIEQEKMFAHFIPFNDLTADLNSEFDIRHRELVHDDDNDYKGGGKKYSPRFRVTLPFYPFRSLTPWFQKDGNLTQAITIIPPMMKIRVTIKKNNDFDLLNMGNNFDIPLNAERNSSTRTLQANELTTEVNFHYDDVYLNVTRAVPEPTFNLYKNGEFTTPFNYSRFHLHDLPTGSILYSPEIAWTTSKPPDVVYLYFIRDSDLVKVPNQNLTCSTNRFFKPPGLSSIRIQQRSQAGINPLSCLEILNLNEFDYHQSKEQYFSYLKDNHFLSPNVKFEQLFQTKDTLSGTATGSLNVFPINFRKLTGIESSVFLRGLKVTLEFTQTLSQSWKLVALYQYQGSVKYQSHGADPPEVTFDTIE